MAWVQRNGGAQVEIVLGRENHRGKPFEVTDAEAKHLLAGQDKDDPNWQRVKAPKTKAAQKAGARPTPEPDASVEGTPTLAGSTPAPDAERDEQEES